MRIQAVIIDRRRLMHNAVKRSPRGNRLVTFFGDWKCNRVCFSPFSGGSDVLSWKKTGTMTFFRLSASFWYVLHCGRCKFCYFTARFKTCKGCRLANIATWQLVTLSKKKSKVSSVKFKSLFQIFIRHGSPILIFRPYVPTLAATSGHFVLQSGTHGNRGTLN